MIYASLTFPEGEEKINRIFCKWKCQVVGNKVVDEMLDIDHLHDL